MSMSCLFGRLSGLADGGKSKRNREGWINVVQAIKGTWGMSWHQEAMKGVEDCEKLGGAVKQVLIPGFPN